VPPTTTVANASEPSLRANGVASHKTGSFRHNSENECHSVNLCGVGFCAPRSKVSIRLSHDYNPKHCILSG